MAKTTKLTYRFFVGDQQVDKLTPEQLEVMAQRMSEAMSRYYTNHPEEYIELLKDFD